MTKLPLGRALVWEALLPRARTGMSARNPSTPTKQSFGDKCVPKPELGNEKEIRVMRVRRSLKKTAVILNGVSPWAEAAVGTSGGGGRASRRWAKRSEEPLSPPAKLRCQ